MSTFILPEKEGHGTAPKERKRMPIVSPHMLTSLTGIPNPDSKWIKFHSEVRILAFAEVYLHLLFISAVIP